MRNIPVRRDNHAFQTEQIRSGNGKVPLVNPNVLATLPASATVLIGDRTAKFGGGLAATGYVMVGGKAIATIPVSSTDVARASLEVK
jgi:hypothetical protein